MKNLKRIAMILAAMAVAMMAFTACGGEEPTAPESSVAEVQTEAEPETEAETEPETEPETEAETDEKGFTLMDVDSSMIKTGLYATGENGEEIVFSIFNNGTADYCSLMMFEADSTNYVICGVYDAATETDENGIAWTKLSFTDAYSGNDCVIGFAEADDECYILDQQGNAYEAEYLSAEDTVTYMASAIVVSDEIANSEGEDDAVEGGEASDGFTLLDVDASMVDTGLYATGENNEEIVLTLFTKDGAKYCSLMMFEADGSNDVICGEYAAATETDEEGIDWTMLTFTDVYTGNACVIGFAEADGECYILDLERNGYVAKYLTADETTTYMAAAVVAAADEANAE